MPDAWSPRHEKDRSLSSSDHGLFASGARRPGGGAESEQVRMEAMRYLAGRLAHTLNNALTALLGFGELLQRVLPPDPKASEYLGQVLQAGARTSALVKLLEGFGGRRTLDCRPVGVGDLLLGVLPALRSRMGPGPEVEIDVAADVPAVNADPVALERVILALADQARVLADGALAVRLDARVVPREEGLPTQVLLGLRYAALPLPEDVAARIFEPYALPKGRGPASGLALAAAWGAVDQHGGRLSFRQASEGEHVWEIALPVA